MSDIDSTARYFDKIGGIDLLEREQEVDLARRMQIGVEAARRVLEMASPKDGDPEDMVGDQSRPALFADALAHANDSAVESDLKPLVLDGVAARDEFIMANLRLAIGRAGKYRDSSFTRDDLVQFATEGVISAVDTYDPKKARFSTHAVKEIRFALTRNIDNLSRPIRVPVNVATELRKLSRTVRELSADRADLPAISEIAQHMEISTKRVEELLQLRMPVTSLDIPDEHERGTVGDLIPDTHFLSPEEQVVHIDDFELVDTILGKLEETSPEGAQVIKRKFGIGRTAPMSYKQIADELDISIHKVQRILARDMPKLRAIATMLTTDEPSRY